MTWETAGAESLTSIDIRMDVLAKTDSESSGILLIFSLQYHNSTLCMERDRPLKLHLLWGRKHVFLITIYHETDCKNTFCCTSRLRNMLIAKLIPQRWIQSFIWFYLVCEDVPGDPWHCLLMLRLQLPCSLPTNTHLLCGLNVIHHRLTIFLSSPSSTL